MPDKQLAKIQLLLLDVDGVLTDGRIIYSDSGEQIKEFNSKDGLGLRLLMDSGIKVGIITGRKSRALRHRLDNLGITLAFDGVRDKAGVVDTISSQTGIPPENMAYVGDDLIDLPAMIRVGTAFCVADASPEIKPYCHYASRLNGGNGAVRDICERILTAKGLWKNILAGYLNP